MTFPYKSVIVMLTVILTATLIVFAINLMVQSGMEQKISDLQEQVDQYAEYTQMSIGIPSKEPEVLEWVR